jgi:hypothetical protein
MRSSLALLALLAGLVAVGAGVRQASADRPTSPARLVDGCRSDPRSALCREVRRLCATKAVRDDVVPACQELGWYGDSIYREIVNLCPLDPTHADCEDVKAKCEHSQADRIGEDGARICREMGWGEYAYSKLEAGGAADADADADADEPAREGGVVGGTIEPVRAGALLPIRYRPGWQAGIEGVGLRVGFVEDAALLGDHETLYSAHLSSTSVSFTSLPLAVVAWGDLGRASGGGTIYRLDVAAGLGRWWTPHLAAALVAGAGFSGLSGSVPAAADLPVRLVGVVHAGDRLTLAGWAQAEWYTMTEDSRRSGSSSLSFADAAELGVALLWAQRTPANVGFGWGIWLGGLYQEQNDTRILSFMLGFGQAHNPWNQ